MRKYILQELADLTGLTMSAFEASLFAKELGAKLVLPIHMDNEKYPTDVNYMKENFNKFETNYKILNIKKTSLIQTYTTLKTGGKNENIII